MRGQRANHKLVKNQNKLIMGKNKINGTTIKSFLYLLGLSRLQFFQCELDPVGAVFDIAICGKKSIENIIKMILFRQSRSRRTSFLNRRYFFSIIDQANSYSCQCYWIFQQVMHYRIYVRRNYRYQNNWKSKYLKGKNCPQTLEPRIFFDSTNIKSVKNRPYQLMIKSRLPHPVYACVSHIGEPFGITYVS